MDYRPLNSRLKKDSGGLGDINGILDRMKDSQFFTSLDLAQAYHQLELREEDKHKTAFRDPTGRLLEFNVCSFGICTIPAVFSATLGDDLRPVLGKGVEKWLDDILLHTKTLEEHFALLRRVLQILSEAGYVINFTKSEFFHAELEFLGVMVGRHGTRPAPSKVKAVQDMKMPSTVGEVRAFLGLAGYLRGFVPDFSGLVAPISDLLRNKEFSSKRARHRQVPWGPTQAAAFGEIVERLTTHPILTLPDWSKEFTLHTDASKLAAGAVLTQSVEERDSPVGYASKRFSRTEEKLSSNDREVLGVLYSLEHFNTYLQHRRFSLVTDCAALLWLFTSQNLSAKMHRWALKMLSYDMDLKWRKGTEHIAPDALSRLRRRGPAGPEIDTSIPGDSAITPQQKSPVGPVLEGTVLQDLAPQDGERKEESAEEEYLASLTRGRQESGDAVEPDPVIVDGICLADLGATEIDSGHKMNLSTIYAVQLTPDQPEKEDTLWATNYEQVRTFLSPKIPTAVVIGRGGGGALIATEGLVRVACVIDSDWRTLECIGANEGSRGVELIRQSPNIPDGQRILADVKPEIILGNACCVDDGNGVPAASARTAELIVQLFTSSRTQLLVMETPGGFTETATWRGLLPQLKRAGCEVETASISATSVGIPTSKRRVFVTAVKKYGDDQLAAKLTRWRRNVQRSPPTQPSLGEFLGRHGVYYLKRGKGEKQIFSFAKPAITITQAQIMSKKPHEDHFTAHAQDAGSWDQAQDLTWDDFVKLTTSREQFIVPPTIRTRDAARIMQEFTLPPMLREVLYLLQIQASPRRAERQQADELLIGLAALNLEGGEDGAATTREQDRSRFKVTPAVLRSSTRRRREERLHEQRSNQPETGTTTETGGRRRGSQNNPRRSTTSPRPVADPMRDDSPTLQHDQTTQETGATHPTEITPGTEREHPRDAPAQETLPLTICRGHSERLEQMETTLRDIKLLREAQTSDPLLGPIRTALDKGEGEKGDYVLDDQDLLWHAPRGKAHAIAVPRRLVPGVLALTHGTFGHPGVARTTLLVEAKYHWPGLKSEVRDYVLSCKCRMRKRPWSTQLYMLPARFLHPWEVLEMDIQDMKVTSSQGNRYLLVVVDRATKFLSAAPLPTKEALGVSKKLLELLLNFGLPLSIRCDPGSENTAEVMQNLCRWLKVSLDYGPTTHPRAQGSVERLGGWLQEALSELCVNWPERWDEYVSIATWIHRMEPDESLPHHASPYKMLFGRDPRTPLDQLSPGLDNSGPVRGLERTVEEQRRISVEVKRILEKRQANKNRGRRLQNEKIARTAPGAKAKAGDYVLVRKSVASLQKEGPHPKLAHDHFSGPWQVVEVIRPGLTFAVTLAGRQTRRRNVAATDIKPFHSRSKDLKLPFEDEFGHHVWSADLGLVEASVVAAPLYTLTDRRAVQNSSGSSTSWTWEYRGKYQDGTLSDWLTEDQTRDSFSPLQLDVFHAMWEHYHGPSRAPRPAGAPSRSERDVATRTKALREFPIGTEVGRELTDQGGHAVIRKGRVCDFGDPYWRVEYPDGDWEELSRRELRKAVTMATHPRPDSTN